MFSIFNTIRCRAPAAYVKALTYRQRVRHVSHFNKMRAQPNEFYLEMQRQDLRRLNDLMEERKRCFDDRLCCGKPPLMKVITADAPHHKCRKSHCRM